MGDLMTFFYLFMLVYFVVQLERINHSLSSINKILKAILEKEADTGSTDPHPKP